MVDLTPPSRVARVCAGLSCEIAGAEPLSRSLEAASAHGIEVVRVPCLGRCDKAPVVALGLHPIERASFETTVAAARSHGAVTPTLRLVDFDDYVRNGGYRLYRACLAGAHTPEEIVGVIERSGLRGLGGAGSPTGHKWRGLRAAPSPRCLVVNAHEGEPGTFKDRFYLETDPHRALEGVLIAAWAIEAAEAYLCVREDDSGARALLREEIARLGHAGYGAGTRLEVRPSPGGHLAGEETALLESLEGRAAVPRRTPPTPAEAGLFGRPTLVNNIETLYWVRDIVERGADWFIGQGRGGCAGLRTYSISGRVKEPGVKLAPAGITARRLIEEYCDGMAEGHTLSAYLPGGASGGILPAGLADVPLDFGTLEPHGGHIGTAALIVLSEKDDLRAVALNLMRGFARESCGRCTPCRGGIEAALTFLETRPTRLAGLDDLARSMADGSICGLGQAAVRLLRTLLTHFRLAIG